MKKTDIVECVKKCVTSIGYLVIILNFMVQFKNGMYLSYTEAYLGPCQTSIKKLLSKSRTCTRRYLKLIIDVSQDPK